MLLVNIEYIPGKEIEALGGKAEALQCNVSEYDKAAEMMEYVVQTYGRWWAARSPAIRRCSTRPGRSR